ncbi:crotonase/enoyl-CoA hydratase family protein [Rhodococcus sp. ARC_M6]|uniref:crotonase/enoyl-CoA hydratase family protein n=1 Tax=Rhodococcus sp. ARC_M6 TaxID=2928852 RepID=UPI0035ADE270
MADIAQEIIMTYSYGPGAEVFSERRGFISIITINRPSARNAVNAAVAEGIGDALADAESDPRIRVIVLTGSGDLSFCGGGDLKAMAAGEDLVPNDPVKRARGFGGVCEHVIEKPIIAAVNGFAIGGGAEIALACDLVVADPKAEFSLPEVRNGFIASAGGAIRLAQWLPKAIAMEVLLIGDHFGAHQAKEWGLVNRISEPGASLESALELAASVAANAPLAVQSTKRLVAGIVDGSLVGEQAAWGRSYAEMARVGATRDSREGPLAFAQKREPVWEGR